MTALATPEARLFQPHVQVRDLETNAARTMLAGRAVPYGEEANIGWFMEEFAAGSLGKSVRESAKALPLLLFHDSQAWPIGVATEWKESAEGLDGVWRLDSGDTAQRAAQLAADEMLGFMSIRFEPIRSDWTLAEEFNPDMGPAYMDRVVRREARLVETSVVSTPAYKGAAISWVRSGEQTRKRANRSATPALDAARALLEEIR